MHAALKRVTDTVNHLVLKFPWAGWSAWLVFCIVALTRTSPRRFASTFEYYLEAAERLSAHGQIYDPNNLGAFLYLPVTLLVYTPFAFIDHRLAAGFWQVVFAAVFTWGCLSLTRALFPHSAGEIKADWLAGLVLLINIPAAWFNFKGVQAQIIMTGAMLIAAAAIMRAQWLRATLWLCIAFIFKPTSLVMVLLCGLLCARMRLPLAIALVVAIVLPFAIFDTAYIVDQYRDFAFKLWLIATAPAQEWLYRADISTFLAAFGVVLPQTASLAVRVTAALGTAYLAWRVYETKAPRSFAFAIVILSACYINLFSPRNEFLSFLVLTPSLTVLGFILLARDQGDWRGWALVLAALVLGMWWSLSFDAIAKPAIVLVISAWLIWLMVRPERWVNLIENASPALSN